MKATSGQGGRQSGERVIAGAQGGRDAVDRCGGIRDPDHRSRRPHRSVPRGLTAFGETMSDESIEDERLIIEYDRMIGVSDHGQLVAGAGAYSFEHTLPGNTFVPVAGVTWVGCLPSHRRQGILTSMMQHQLDDVSERGEPVAILTASEAVIYGRFGYGLSTQAVWAKVQKHRGAFAARRRPTAASGSSGVTSGPRSSRRCSTSFGAHAPGRSTAARASGRRFCSTASLIERVRRRCTSSSTRTTPGPRTGTRGTGSATVGTREPNTVIALEVISADPEVEAALWRFLLDIDLADTVEVHAQPIDSVLPWRLKDSRAYQVSYVGDWLWTRMLDVPAALSARRYATEGSLVLEVVDEFRPNGAANGRFRLDAAPRRGRVRARRRQCRTRCHGGRVRARKRLPRWRAVDDPRRRGQSVGHARGVATGRRAVCVQPRAVLQHDVLRSPARFRCGPLRSPPTGRCGSEGRARSPERT